MQIFITGTNTNIGKTLISTWICLHLGYDYYKPIQSGSIDGTDSDFVQNFTASKIHPESYKFNAPLAPYLAAERENQLINIDKIHWPNSKNLIIEGAGGLMVPLNKDMMLIDLIKIIKIPVILVASSALGTINHTLLSLEALRNRNIEILGVIVNGEANRENCQAIESFGKIKVLAEFPYLSEITRTSLKHIPLTDSLNKILGI